MTVQSRSRSRTTSRSSVSSLQALEIACTCAGNADLGPLARPHTTVARPRCAITTNRLTTNNRPWNESRSKPSPRLCAARCRTELDREPLDKPQLGDHELGGPGTDRHRKPCAVGGEVGIEAGEPIAAAAGGRGRRGDEPQDHGAQGRNPPRCHRRVTLWVVIDHVVSRAYADRAAERCAICITSTAAVTWIVLLCSRSLPSTTLPTTCSDVRTRSGAIANPVPREVPSEIRTTSDRRATTPTSSYDRPLPNRTQSAWDLDAVVG